MLISCTSTISYKYIRSEMLRPLTPSEILLYRGITSSSATGRKYNNLYNITTAEDLITAEWYGRCATPKDEPEHMYLFSAGRGKTAKCNDEYVKQTRKRWADGEEKDETGEMRRIRERHVPQTMEELHMQYLNLEVPGTEEKKRKLEEHLEEVARDFVHWWNEMVMTDGFGCSHGKAVGAGKGEEKGI
jgi:hypothetical protein